MRSGHHARHSLRNWRESIPDGRRMVSIDPHKAEIERLESKVRGLELSIELEQVIINYLEPFMEKWRKQSFEIEDLNNRANQYTTSKTTIRGWERDLKDYKQLLLITRLAGEHST